MVLVGILNTDLLWRTKINLRYDKIVIGSSLEAVLFAFNNELPIFFTEREEPFRFDHFSPEIDLSYLKIEPVTRALSTFNGDKIVGVPKRVLWERLLFVLSLTTRIPVAHLCTSMSVIISETKIVLNFCLRKWLTPNNIYVMIGLRSIVEGSTRSI